MRLVTFTDGSGFERAGALLENDQIVLDLQAACRELQGRERAELVSVLALVEAGEDGLALARSLVERVPAQAVHERALVKLRAPIQPPPQMRDCSCFELHLRQSFAAARRARALRTPDPEATLKAMNTRADDRVIDTFNRQPIYYKCNRFAVIGIDDEFQWPSFTQALDFELEFGCYIGRRGKDISRDLIGRLHARGLIGTGPRSPRRGAPYTYVTTNEFLVAFDLQTLQDLPDREQMEDAGLAKA